MTEQLHEWKCIDNPKYSSTYRMKVPNGWLYKYTTENNISICFVPEEEKTEDEKDFDEKILLTKKESESEFSLILDLLKRIHEFVPMLTLNEIFIAALNYPPAGSDFLNTPNDTLIKALMGYEYTLKKNHKPFIK